MVKIGLIGGSGVYQIEGLHQKEKKQYTTPFGYPSDAFHVGVFKEREICFLPRHGSKHHMPPHKINFRANLWAFRELGVETIISIGAVGSIAQELKPGSIVAADQIIDSTHSRSSSFFDGPEVVHIDFTEPYCEETRQSIIQSGMAAHIELHKRGTYVATEGPRLETAAEIKAFKILGGDIVGMTGMPEAALARELGICFATIAVVTNFAAGISKQALTSTEVIEVMKRTTDKVKTLLGEAIVSLPDEKTCKCKDSLVEGKIN